MDDDILLGLGLVGATAGLALTTAMLVTHEHSNDGHVHLVTPEQCLSIQMKDRELTNAKIETNIVKPTEGQDAVYTLCTCFTENAEAFSIQRPYDNIQKSTIVTDIEQFNSQTGNYCLTNTDHIRLEF